MARLGGQWWRMKLSRKREVADLKNKKRGLNCIPKKGEFLFEGKRDQRRFFSRFFGGFQKKRSGGTLLNLNYRQKRVWPGS